MDAADGRGMWCHLRVWYSQWSITGDRAVGLRVNKVYTDIIIHSMVSGDKGNKWDIKI